MSEPPPGAVVRGPADQAAKAIQEARGNYAAAMRSERVTDKLNDAELNAAASHSGLNVENNIRQQAKAILKSDKLSAGFSPDELAAINGVVAPGASRFLLRHVGNMLGGGGGLGAVGADAIGGAIGAAFGGPVGAAIGAAGTGAAGFSATDAIKCACPPKHERRRRTGPPA